MVFSEEQIEKINSYIDNEDFKKLCIELNICSENDQEELLEKIKEYIEDDMMGKFRGQSAINKFLKSIDIYLKNNDFERQNEGYINYNVVLPIANSILRDGLRVEQDILGHDRKQYIVKQVEGYKGPISDFEDSKQAKYNPTMAYAFFKFVGVPCARNLMAFEGFPYYYIFSENFLNKNEKMYGLDDNKFMNTEFVIDEENNITHKQIMDRIEATIGKQNISPDKTILLSKKVKLQYAVQETLKCLICSADESLKNTSLIVKEGKDGEIEDINVSPAYDVDLSFNIGERMLEGIPKNAIFSRTTQSGKIDLVSIINEFKAIDGYKDALGEIKNKLNDNYINQIFDIAYEESQVEMFKDKKLKDKFANFIMRRVATFKEACKEIINKESILKNE